MTINPTPEFAAAVDLPERRQTCIPQAIGDQPWIAITTEEAASDTLCNMNESGAHLPEVWAARAGSQSVNLPGGPVD